MIAAIDYAQHTQTRNRHPSSYTMPSTELWTLLKTTDARVKRCSQGHGLVEVLTETDLNSPSGVRAQSRVAFDKGPSLTSTQVACDILRSPKSGGGGGGGSRSRPATAAPVLRRSFSGPGPHRSSSSTHSDLGDPGAAADFRGSQGSLRRHKRHRQPASGSRDLGLSQPSLVSQVSLAHSQHRARLRTASAETRWGGKDPLDRREDPRFLLRRQPKAERVLTSAELLLAAEEAGARESAAAVSDDGSSLPDRNMSPGGFPQREELESPSGSKFNDGGATVDFHSSIDNSTMLRSTGYVKQKTRHRHRSSPEPKVDENASVGTDLVTMTDDSLSVAHGERRMVADRLDSQIKDYETRRHPAEKRLPLHLRMTASGRLGSGDDLQPECEGGTATGSTFDDGPASAPTSGLDGGGGESASTPTAPPDSKLPEPVKLRFTPSQVKFNLSRQARLHFGSRVALETKKNHFLMMVPEYGLCRRRNRPKGHVCLSVMVSKPLNQCDNEDHLVFKVIDMQNPGSNRPVMYGDDIWLQVTQSDSEDTPQGRRRKKKKEDELPKEWALGQSLVGSAVDGGAAGGAPGRPLNASFRKVVPTLTPGMINVCVVGARVDKAAHLPNSVNTGRYMGSQNDETKASRGQRRCGVPVPLNTVMAKDRTGSTGDTAAVDYVGRWKIRNFAQPKLHSVCRRPKENDDRDAVMNYSEIVLEQDFFCLVADPRTGNVFLRSHTNHEMVAGAVDNSVRGNQLRMRMLHDTVESGMGKIEMKDLEVIQEATTTLLQSQKMREGAISYVSTTTDETPITSGRPFTRCLRRNIASRAHQLEREDIDRHLHKEDSISHFTSVERDRSLSPTEHLEQDSQIPSVDRLDSTVTKQKQVKPRRDWDVETEHIHRTVRGRMAVMATVDDQVVDVDSVGGDSEGASLQSPDPAAAAAAAAAAHSNTSLGGGSTVTGPGGSLQSGTSGKRPHSPNPNPEDSSGTHPHGRHGSRPGTSPANGRVTQLTKGRRPMSSPAKTLRFVSSKNLFDDDESSKPTGPRTGSLEYVADEVIKKHFEYDLLTTNLGQNDDRIKHWIHYKEKKARSEKLMLTMSGRILDPTERTLDASNNKKAVIASRPSPEVVAALAQQNGLDIPAEAAEPRMSDESEHALPSGGSTKPESSGGNRGTMTLKDRRKMRMSTSEQVASSVQVGLTDTRSIDVGQTLKLFSGQKVTMAVKIKEVFMTYAKRWQQVLSACFAEFSFHGIEQVCNMCENACRSFVSTGLATALDQLRILTKSMKLRASSGDGFGDPEGVRDAKKLLEARLERLHWMMVLLMLTTESLGFPALPNRLIGIPGWRRVAHPVAPRSKGGAAAAPGPGGVSEQFSQFSQYSLKTDAKVT